MRIKELPKSERPRERLIKQGPAALSDAELLALILRTGSKKENVIELATKLLKKFDLKKLSRANVTILNKVFGVGEAKACQLAACFEFAKRVASLKAERKNKINGPKDVANLLLPEMRFLKKEHFKCVYLDSRNKLLKQETLFIGSLNSNIVSPREIFETSLDESAAAVILAHNHPSGDAMPSSEDIEVTKDIVKAGKLLGIEVLDHLIIGDKNYVSMREKGLIKF